jgi:hypothetical protein
LVRPGDNTIQLSKYTIAKEVNKVFFFAVECIHVVDHSEITAMPSKPSVKECMTTITSALTRSQDEEI